MGDGTPDRTTGYGIYEAIPTIEGMGMIPEYAAHVRKTINAKAGKVKKDKGDDSETDADNSNDDHLPIIYD